MDNYELQEPGGGRASADARDYWLRAEDARDDGFDSWTLVKLRHRWRVSAGCWLLAPRVLKRAPTFRDLLRLRRAVDSREHWAEHTARERAAARGID